MKTAASAAIAVVVLGAAAFMKPRPDVRAVDVRVERAPFVESIVESGSVTAARMALYGAPLGSLPAKIVDLVAEGTAVEAGDLLVRLDTTPLDQLVAREAAALRRAEADLRANAIDVDMKARNERLQLMEAEAALAEADREMTRARSAVEDFRPMLAEGFITRPEFERAEQALLRAADQRRLALARRDLRLQGATSPGSRRPAAGPSGATAALVDEIRARLVALQRQIAMSTIRAEGPGLVVYRELFFGSERRKPQVGDEALPNQPLLAVPDASTLIVDTRVREIDLHRVASSQRVVVRLDAYPDLEIEGAVDVVGALAQADVVAAGTKYFPLSIRLHRVDPRLRSGMTAQVRIEVATIPAVTVIPLEALFEDEEGSYCLVVENDAVRRRAVTIWARSETRAAVHAGLEPGERVRTTRDRK